MAKQDGTLIKPKEAIRYLKKQIQECESEEKRFAKGRNYLEAHREQDKIALMYELIWAVEVGLLAGDWNG